MYEDILELVTIAAQKKNLKESTIHSYRQSLIHFFNSTDKTWKELTVSDVDDFLTAKRLAGIMPQTYNYYYAALRFMYKRVLRLNWDEDEIPVSNKEFDLLHFLASHADKVCTFEEIGNAVWGSYLQSDRRSIMVNVSRLRKKLENYTGETNHIESVWSQGYMFKGK